MKAMKAVRRSLTSQNGFTLIELIVAIGISAIFLIAVVTTQVKLQHSSTQQVEIATVHQNIRGALNIMEWEFRMIGMDWMQSANFGVTDVRRYAITDPATDATPDASASGSPILRMSMDLNDNGQLDAGETITYLLYDRDGDGALFDLARSTVNAGSNSVSGRQLLAEGIEALALAYAFDQDSDGEIDRTNPPANNIIWAVDSNNDGLLDSDLSGAPLGFSVQPRNIKAVQIWILGRAARWTPDYVNSHQYTVGNRVIGPMNDHFHRWVLSEILHCRNL